MEDITPDMLLRAYAAGIFPMAEGRHGDELSWYDPPMRGILPFDGFHVPKRLVKTLRRQRYTVTFDRAFDAVIRGCADARPDTWINDKIIHLYGAAHHMGYAHSAEVWDGETLIGGTYGISLGGAFFGESMFSRKPDASKIALVHLMARLRRRGFTLFDTQFVNDHLLQFGCVEIPRAEYRRRLKAALAQNVSLMDYSEASVSTNPVLSGVSAGAAGDEEVSPSFSSPCFLDSSASFSGSLSGAVSVENFSDFADVESFLHSISQTS